MATRVSKSGNTYNVPTQHATYIPKDQKAYLKTLVNKELEATRTKAAKSMDPAELRMVVMLSDLLEKLSK